MAIERVYLTDGTNVVDFLSGEGAETGYVKANLEGLDPPPCEIRYAGGKPVYRKWLNRDITITFGIKASNASDLTTKQRAIITILENTYRYWTTNGKEGLKAQLQYRRPGGSNTSYIDVFWGECDWGRVEQQAAAPYVYKLAGAQLTLTCEPCFHPASVVNLVNEQVVYNHYDSEHANYIDIAAASILGDIDAPCNIKIRPAVEFAGADIDKFWIAMVGPSVNIKNWGEIDMSYDATRSNASKFVTTVAASYSGWSTPAATYVLNLTAAEWKAMAGRTWHVLAGMYASQTTIKWRLQVMLRGWPSTTIGVIRHTGEEVYHPEANQWCVVDLGPLYISQGMAGEYSGDKLYIGWQKSNPNGAQAIVQADFLFLIPEHKYSLFIDKSAEVLWNYIYRTTTDKLYINTVAGSYGPADFPHHVFTESYIGPENIGCLGSSQRGTYPRLVPGKDNRAYFIFAENIYRHNITRQFKVTIDYLPQYLTPME